MTQVSMEEIGDPVPKVDNRLAVGEDLEFQRRWWRVERIVLSLFAAVVLFDLLGGFGSGLLEKTKLVLPGNAARLEYDRVDRVNTPSILSVDFGPGGVSNGQASLWVSDELAGKLGNQRVIPEAASSTIERGGIRYLFPTRSLPARVEFALQPLRAGLFTLHVQAANGPLEPIHILVAP